MQQLAEFVAHQNLASSVSGAESAAAYPAYDIVQWSDLQIYDQEKLLVS